MLKNYLNLLRTEQYIKNFFVFAPLFFSKELLEKSVFINVSFAFVCFCLAASAIYILNDYFDIHQDRLHPQKQHRPLASGTIKLKNAFIVMTIMASSAILFGCQINTSFAWIIVVYIAMNIAYSKYLKHIAILDINIIAFGFVLRILAGATVSDVKPSIWILLITYLLALFLAIAKRRTDVVLEKKGQQVRKNITAYNLLFIDCTMAILASVLLVCYIFYCIAPENQLNYNSKLLYLSIILVLNGLLRYLKLSLVDQTTYSPTKVVLTDTFLQCILISWIFLMGYLLYF